MLGGGGVPCAGRISAASNCGMGTGLISESESSEISITSIVVLGSITSIAHGRSTLDSCDRHCQLSVSYSEKYIPCCLVNLTGVYGLIPNFWRIRVVCSYKLASAPSKEHRIKVVLTSRSGRYIISLERPEYMNERIRSALCWLNILGLRTGQTFNANIRLSETAWSRSKTRTSACDQPPSITL